MRGRFTRPVLAAADSSCERRRWAVRIAVLGMGKVGGVLGRRWAQVGHGVAFGVRDPGNPDKQERARAAGASLASVRQAAADAEAVLLAMPWRAVPEVLKEAGELSGKVLLDCTNPLT